MILSNQDRFFVRGVDAQGDRYFFATSDLQRAVEWKARLEEELDVRAELVNLSETCSPLTSSAA